MTRGFILNQLLGHAAHGENLKAVLESRADFKYWVLEVPIENAAPCSRERKSDVMLQVYLDTLRSLMSRRYSAASLFFHTLDAALFCPHVVARTPSVVSLDATPLQLKNLSGYHQPLDRPLTIAERMKIAVLSSTRLKFRLTRRVLHAARQIIAWSEWAKTSVVEDYGIDPRKVTCIPPGIDIQAFLPPRERDGGPVKVLFVGGDLERKGGDLLLRWMREDGLDLGCELHLVTKSQIASSPGVLVHRDVAPNSERLTELFHKCHIFALPTRADCSPIALMEALAAGLPAISSNIAGIPEIIRHDETGLMINPDDYIGLSSALRRLVLDADLRSKLGRAARLDAEARFSLRNYEALIDCFIEHTKSPRLVPQLNAAH